jgi:hypothetical protein
MTKDDWIERALLAYVAAGVEPEHALTSADATCGVWIDDGCPGDVTPEQAVEDDLAYWDADGECT